MKSLTVEKPDTSRRDSVFSGSEAGSDVEQRRRLKYGGPLAGSIGHKN